MYKRQIRTRARTHRVNESLDTRTRQKQQLALRLLAAAADWPNSSTQQHAAVAAARQRGRPATSERASHRPFDDPVAWWLSVNVRKRMRRDTHKVNESLNTRTQLKQQQHNDYSQQQQQAADRPSSSSSSSISISSSTQQRRGSGGGQLRASVLSSVMTPCLGGCALFRSVTCAVCCL